ncbi:MAG: uridine diphosphate-N-acetylglucosamine-binding protein YvcK [Candidatus Omnitrophota bacterium]
MRKRYLRSSGKKTTESGRKDDKLKLLKWLYPGMGIKRWIGLTVFGVIMLSMGFVVIIAEEQGQASLGSSLIVILGVLAIITGTKRILNSLISILLPPHTDKELVDIVYTRRQLEKGPRVVVIGGGGGLTAILRGLKEYTSNISAVVTILDEGRFDSSFGNGPDASSEVIRKSLIALADAEPVVEKLFSYRFTKGTELWGYNFGNIFLDAMSGIAGNFDGAVKESSKVLAIRGKVILSTLSKVSIIAKRRDGTETIGKQQILHSASPIQQVHLRPQAAKVTMEAIYAIENADAIVFGPGNLYTNTIPNLLIDSIKSAVLSSRAAKIYMLNIMTVAGETDNCKASDHVRILGEQISPGLVQYCIANKAKVPEELLEKYRAEDSEPVAMDRENFKKLNCKIRAADLLDTTKGFIRHDPSKTSRLIFSVIQESKRSKLYGK